jgi:hypothetical protein
MCYVYCVPIVLAVVRSGIWNLSVEDW